MIGNVYKAFLCWFPTTRPTTPTSHTTHVKTTNPRSPKPRISSSYKQKEVINQSIDQSINRRRAEISEVFPPATLHRSTPPIPIPTTSAYCCNSVEPPKNKHQKKTTQINKKNSSRKKTKTYNRRDSQMVTHSSTSRPVQCLCMAERTGCPVLTDLWSYVLNSTLRRHRNN